MISLRALRRKIRTVRSIQQITRAMKMVSSMKLRRAREKAAASQPFAQKICGLLGTLMASVSGTADAEQLFSAHPLLSKKKGNRIAVVVITADRGLCGGYNSAIMRKTREFLHANRDKEILIAAIGKKGRNALVREKRELFKEYNNILGSLQFSGADELGEDIMGLFLCQCVAEVFVIHAQFRSAIQQPVAVERILPVTIDDIAGEKRDGADFIYEPGPEKLLDYLLPYYVKSNIYHMLLGSLAAEQAARVASMEAATKNAQGVIDALSLQANKLRQERITQELSELIASGM
ncbi:MAG: ATP synthase F1 subunit gamma [Elusimicrobia bacterium RIFOXYA2_FULL_50_26]|nr:MAG: ATP synthase F1 subunit gamma [Elusimicrobia bacterium RIFOXYA2_FULL_50_26]OGS23412.1 MAG: ATP synthase F1 subunit gamma [Elusimicrobia bacterium RIFOXYB2_FULL_50_12]